MIYRAPQAPSPEMPAPRQAPPPLRVVPTGERTGGLNTPPPGRWLDLGRRGRTWVRETPGPEGAPTLVMLHGLGATGGLNWAGSQFVLSDRFRVVALDHRGHGRGIRTRDFRLEDCADDVAACIDVMGLESPIAVGYSMGGPIATLVWRRHPGLLRGMVLAATSRNFRGSPAERLTFEAMGVVGMAPVWLPRRAVRLGGALIGSIPMPAPAPVKDLRWAVEEIAGHDPKSILQAAAAIGRFDSTSWVEGIDIPTSVVITTNDRVVPPARQYRLARAIEQATVHCVEGGHFCVGGGAPKHRFLSALRAACLDVAREPSSAAATAGR